MTHFTIYLIPHDYAIWMVHTHQLLSFLASWYTVPSDIANSTIVHKSVLCNILLNLHNMFLQVLKFTTYLTFYTHMDMIAGEQELHYFHIT